MKNLPPPPEHVTTHLVKLGEQGLLTIALPEMIGRYVVIEQRDGQVVISPMDIESAQCGSAIAHHGNRTTLIASGAGRNIPVA